MDRRKYSRFAIDVEALFILDNRDIFPRDFEGRIVDISEGGFRVVIDSEKYADVLKHVKINDIVHFSIPDDFQLLEKEMSVLVSGYIRIVRKENHDNHIAYGCEFISKDDDIDLYVNFRRTSMYMKNIRRSYLSL